MNSPVEKIKEKLSIVDVISSYISIESSGKNYKARCPFHNEKTPSFFISPDRNTYYCFGCGEKGDIFSFVEKFEGTDFLGSLKLLAARAGVSLSDHSPKTSRDKKEIWYEIMEEATTFFETTLIQNPEARSYLLSRGVTDATISMFRIGYVENKWRSVSDHLISRGYKREDIETVGLIKTKDDGFYDRFRSRIMFPISDSSGRVIAFSGRTFGLPVQTGKSEITEAKYLNSPDTPIFNKSNVLFGIDKAKTAIRTRGYSIVVEGQMDLILSHQAGFTNTVAVSGTALADTTTSNSEEKINNLGLIRRLSSNIIFAYDGDEAGVRAAGRSATIALSLDMQVKITVLPEGKDPADVIGENPDIWKEYIKNSINIISFHIDRICRSIADLRLRGKKIRETIFPFLVMVKSAIERSAYITEIHNKTGLPERAVIEDFELFERTQASNKNIVIEPEAATSLSKHSRRDHLERRLFGIIYWQGDTGDEAMRIKDLCDSFENKIRKDVFQNMLHIHEPFSDSLAFEAEMWYGGKTDSLKKDVQEILLSIEEEILNEEKLSLKPLDTQEKLTQFNTISKRIEEIKQIRSIQ